MDVETSEAIEQLGQRIDALEGSLRGEIGSVRSEIGSVRSEIGALRNEVRAGLAENRRHAEVLFESLRDDIRMLAEGFATRTARLDSGRR
jgi:hypothetical protein